MTRRSLSNIRSNEERSLHEVWDWYEFQRALIGEEKSRVLDALARGTAVATTRYVGRTREELERDFARQVDELGQLTMFGMLAAAEAALRVDFIERVANKKKDDVSRRFRDIHKQRKRKAKQRIGNIRLEEDILDTWRKYATGPAIKNAVADFKGALNLRHWLAHGRYAKPKLGRAAGYDPVDVFDICKQLLQSVSLMPPDPSPSA